LQRKVKDSGVEARIADTQSEWAIVHRPGSVLVRQGPPGVCRDRGGVRLAQPDDLVPADIRARIDPAALQPGGAAATLLGLKDGRRVGDWVNPSR
jgi:hypothetical protein